MKESMSATWEFQIIIIFILIFVAYLTVSVSYYKVFKAKNDIVSIIERQEGLTTGSTKAVGIINNYLMMELIGTDTIEEKRKKMNKVEKDEIVKVAKKVSIDTIFLLEGVKDGEN